MLQALADIVAPEAGVTVVGDVYMMIEKDENDTEKSYFKQISWHPRHALALPIFKAASGSSLFPFFTDFYQLLSCFQNSVVQILIMWSTIK